jgi:5'-methylthioadenosine phosphorylase
MPFSMPPCDEISSKKFPPASSGLPTAVPLAILAIKAAVTARKDQGGPMARTMIGVIGGSGLYEIDGLEGAGWIAVETPWGAPSDAILTGTLAGMPMAFLPRHGRGHVHAPSDIPYRANIDALKRLGVTDLVSVSACGSFREQMAPGDFVVVDQFIDRTVARPKSFFGTGCVAHVSMAHPTCPRLGAACIEAARTAGVTVHAGGTYLAMEGPQFSTVAESSMYRDAWGVDVIGMTNMPECKLAREAELCYASIAMVTDYDSWHPDHGAVDISEIVRILTGNAAKGRAMVAGLPALLDRDRAACPHGCDRALDHAILTAQDKRDPALLARLDAVAGRVIGRA